MLRFLLLFLSLCLTLAAAQPPAYPHSIVQHRVAPNGAESLCTPVARYTDASGRTVDLVGAVHLADAAYYRNLNRAFKRYDFVLYEMVDGEGLPEQLRLARKVKQGNATAEEKARFEAATAAEGKAGGAAGLLRSYYAMMSETLRLRQQTECIDYSLHNMVFADLSMQELRAAMAKRGESWLSLALQALRADNSSVSSSLAFSPRALRREVIRALAASSHGAPLQQSSIIVARNERCFEVLDRCLASAPAATRIAIFYGAMHLRDMHHRLIARGFTLQGVQWLTAIRG
ncbi:MAG: hypothetical protein Q4F38_10075 [Akkermansia sp.]|nr:hypothetical protein [Akkermansia sp.]